MPPRMINRTEDTVATAIRLLQAADVTVLRQLERGQTIPAEWVTYREALRDAVRTGQGTIPARPVWPE
jgi:hypothetical protein